MPRLDFSDLYFPLGQSGEFLEIPQNFSPWEQARLKASWAFSITWHWGRELPHSLSVSKSLVMLGRSQSTSGSPSLPSWSLPIRLLQRVGLGCELWDQGPAAGAGGRQPRPCKMDVSPSNFYHPPLGRSRSGRSLGCVTPVLAAGSEMP